MNNRRWAAVVVVLAVTGALVSAGCGGRPSLGLHGREADSPGNGLAAYQEAIRLKPDYAEAHYNLGVAYGELGRYQEEIAAYQEAIRLKPDYADAHCNLGVAYGALSRYQEEIAAYQEAIRLQPDLADVHYNLGVAYGELGRYEEEIAAYQEAIRVKPDDADAHFNLGLAYLARGDRGAALEQSRILLNLDPGLAVRLFACMYPSE